MREQDVATEAGASPLDLYLSPHSDDICFSLGALAHRRKAGTLLTILPLSGYLPRHDRVPRPPAEQVTRERMAEDARFAAACNLQLRFLELGCATYLGRRSDELPWVAENADRIEPVLMAALSEWATPSQPGVRPWLFCPSGIGGHVDHVAIRMIVTRHLERLTDRFHVAFYEDLSYAHDPVARWSGIVDLLRGLPGRSLRRHAWPLGDAVRIKVELIRLYPSQLLAPQESIGRFTPASDAIPLPHEAVWTTESASPA